MGEVLETATLDGAVLNTLLAAIPTAALLVDDNGTIRAANAELLRLLRYPEGALDGAPLDTLLPERLRERHTAFLCRFMVAPTSRRMGAAGQQFTALRSDGGEVPVEIGLTPVVTSHGRRVLATLVDQSASRKANELFRQLVESAPYGLLIMDSRGRITLTNKHVLDMFGYQSDDLAGAPIEVLMAERYRAGHVGVRNAYATTREVRRMGPGRDLTAQHRDGTEFPVEIGLSPIDIDGEPCTLAAIIDITERKKMEIELRRANTNLEEFTFIASHDLRSPLRGIADLLNWIQEDVSAQATPDITRNFERAHLRLSRMDQLINNLLAYARAGRSSNDTTSIDIAAVVDRIEELIEVPAGFSVTRQLSSSTFVGHLTPLETVLRNLISNAIKHHDKPAGSVTISSVDEGSFCHIMVRDDGPGIPPQAHERIFKLFQTLNSNSNQSTGIGLAVSRRMTESHGGTINVTANEGQRGVTFHVYWPRFLRKDINNASPT